VGVGHAGGGFHFFIRGFGAAKKDIFAHRAVEKIDILQHDAGLLAQRFQIEPADIHAVQADAAALHIVETRDQADQGGFSHAGGADKGYHLVCGYIQIDMLEHIVAVAIGEGDILETQRAAHRLGQRQGLRLLLHLFVFCQQPGYPVGAGQGALHIFPGAGKVADRLVKDFKIKEEGNQVAERQRALHGQAAAEKDHHQRPQRGSQLDKGGEDCHQPQRT